MNKPPLVALVVALLLVSIFSSLTDVSALTHHTIVAPSLLKPGDSIKYWIEQNTTSNMVITAPASYVNFANFSLSVVGELEVRVVAVHQEQLTLNITCDLKVTSDINASDVFNEGFLRENLGELERTLAQKCSQGLVVNVPHEAVLFFFSQPFNSTSADLVSELREFIEGLGVSYNLTVDEEIYEGRQAIRVSLRAGSNFSSTNSNATVELVGIFDQVTGIPLYQQANVSGTAVLTIGETSIYTESSGKYLVKITDASLLSSLTTRAYKAKSPSGDLHIVVSGGGLEVKNVSFTGSRVVFRVAGAGLGYVTVKLPGNVSIIEARVDGRPVKHLELWLSGENAKIVKVPVPLSEHSVELVLSTEIQALSEVSTESPEAGGSLLSGDSMLLAGAVILAVLAVVAAVLVLRRSKRSSPA